MLQLLDHAYLNAPVKMSCAPEQLFHIYSKLTLFNQVLSIVCPKRSFSPIVIRFRFDPNIQETLGERPISIHLLGNNGVMFIILRQRLSLYIVSGVGHVC